MPKCKRSLTAAEEMTAKEIRAGYGGMLNLKSVAEYLGVSRHTAERWVQDMDAVVINGRKRYTAADMARKLEASRIPGGN